MLSNKSINFHVVYINIFFVGPEDQNLQEGEDRSTSGGANRGYRGSRRGQSRGRPFGRGGYRANATAAYQGHVFGTFIGFLISYVIYQLGRDFGLSRTKCGSEVER